MFTLRWDCHRNSRVQFEAKIPSLAMRRLFFVGMVEDKVLLHEPWTSATNAVQEFVPSQYHLAKIVVGEVVDGVLPAGTVLEIVQSKDVQEVRDAGGTGTIAAFKED